MSYDTDNPLKLPDDATDRPALPPDLVFTDRMMTDLRDWLRAHQLDDHQIFFCEGEPAATWESGAAGQTIRILGRHEKSGELHHTGFLHLRRHRIVLANWRWIGLADGLVRTFWLCAAPSPQHYERVRKAVRKLRRAGAKSMWQIVSGDAWRDGPRSRRENVSTDDLVLPAALRRRIDIDIIGFFDAKVAAMYLAMGLPHRRGVLLHGPPGNGKTTLIRAIGAALPEVPVLILRPSGAFDSDDLQQVLRRWSRQAPAILVIEDLNWLLKSIDVSLLLNLLDGIDSRSGIGDGGLMLIATTNHPEQLDPALNNRPGRFDVVIEIPLPDESARAQSLRRRLPTTGPCSWTSMAASSTSPSRRTRSASRRGCARCCPRWRSAWAVRWRW